MKKTKEKITKTIGLLAILAIPTYMTYYGPHGTMRQKREAITIGSCRIHYREGANTSRLYLVDTAYESKPNLLAFFDNTTNVMHYRNVVDKQDIGVFDSVQKDSLESLLKKYKK